MLFLLTAPVFYSRFAQFLNFLEVIGVALALPIVVVGIRKGHKGGWLYIVSMILMAAIYLHDVLNAMNIIRTSNQKLTIGGLVIFIFIQMLIMAGRIKSFKTKEAMAEMAFLQAQIKPHFLYNSLNTIIAVSHYDMPKARKLLLDFSHYLRRTFDFEDQSQLVSLKSDLELVQAYLEIEKARFEERVEITFDIPENPEGRVPLLILQPIVENALIHGILPKPEGGWVAITIRNYGESLHFEVRDNGVGLSREGIEQILQTEKEKGVGLHNIDRRLKRLFGKGLDVQSTLGEGTVVRWEVPLSNKGIRGRRTVR